MKRWIIGIILVVSLLVGIAEADDYTVNVSNYTELASSFGYANDHPGIHVIVNITEDFTMSSGVGIHGENVELTIFGNKHTLNMNGFTIGARDGAFLNLGSEDGGDKNVLTLDANEVMNLNAIVAISETSSSATVTTLNMYDGVTLMNNTVQGYGNSGRGVHMLGGIFNMYGGTIKNNSAGTTQNGGAVCVSNDRAAGSVATYIAEFNMYGGSLEGNEAYFGGAVYLLNGTTFNMYGGEIHGNTALYGGGAIFLTANDKVNIYGGEIYENSARIAGGGAYVSNNAILTVAGGEIHDNTAQSMGGGVYTEQVDGSGSPGGTLIMTDGAIYNNTAGSNGADITNRGTLSLSSASDMKKEFHDSGFTIDAWYYDIDYSSYGIYRWDLTQAFAGNSSRNYYYGDIISPESGLVPLIAAFTAYDRITITKNWEDYDNQYGTRPDEVKVTLKDASGSTVQLMTLVEGATGADATVTLNEENNWTATISPLAIADYSTGYTLSEDAVEGYNSSIITIGNKTNDEINGTTYTSGSYTTSFTNTYRRPITIYKFWDDSNNKDEIRPTDTEKMKISVLLGNAVVTDANGNPLEDITLTRYDTTGRDDDHPIGTEMTADDPTSATEIWATTVYVEAPADFESLVFKETITPDEYYANGGSISYGEGGAMTRIMINKHDLKPLSDYVTNENTVEIHFQVDKEWTGDKNWDRPMPTIYAILKANGEQIGKEKITAVTDETTGEVTGYSAVFHNVPKYVDNENDTLVYYSIEELIDDPLWINGGQTIDAAGKITYEWYYMTGEGKYKVTIETVQPTLETESLEIVQGSKITNEYELFQKTTTVDVTKLWKDHRNESGARPEYLKLGLFDPDGNLAAEVELFGGSTADSWAGTFEGYTDSEGNFIKLPLYNEDGSYVDYSQYIIKEQYSTNVTTSASGETIIEWSDWQNSGDEYILTIEGNDYQYTYTDRGSDVINLDILRNLGENAPAYSSLIGLFENEGDTEPVRTAYLTSAAGNGGERIITELAAYDDDGNEIDYTGYVVKESSDEGNTWKTVDASIEKDGASYVFNFPNSATISINASIAWTTDSTYLKVALFDSDGNQVGNAITLSGPEGKLNGLPVYGTGSTAIDYTSGYAIKYASPAATAEDGSVTTWGGWSDGVTVSTAEGTYQYVAELN